jgi:SAM-dependent methyltransferase
VGNYDPIELLFGGMEKLGPGDNANTLRVLNLLPREDFRLVVDAGCGSGRQTLALAKALGIVIHAIDVYEPFLKDLTRRAREVSLEHLVQAHCMDMQDIPKRFQDIDLLWAEGSAYNIGFSNALKSWASSITPGGFFVVSELSWVREQVPDQVKVFFQSAYPDMQSVQRNIEVSEIAGYKVLGTHTLPRESWVKGYYDILRPRAQALKDHVDASVREFARETLREIEIFEISQDSYGYVFLMLQRA